MSYRKTSNKNELDINDIKRWAKNTLIFSIPSLVIVHASIVGGADIKYAVGAVSAQVVASLIDLGKKFSQA